MFCIKCGARNSDEAIYCQKCGALLEAEQETRIARAPKSVVAVRGGVDKNAFARAPDAEEERQIFSITPTLLFVKIGYAAAMLGALLLVAFLSAFLPSVPIGIAIALGLALLLIPAFYHLRHKLVRYTLTDSKIEIEKGLISKMTRNVPLRTIQDVTVSATVPQRMFGLGDLIIENAGETGGRITLRNVNAPKKYADELLKQMRRLNK